MCHRYVTEMFHILKIKTSRHVTTEAPISQIHVLVLVTDRDVISMTITHTELLSV